MKKNILILMDSFKRTMSSIEISAIIADVLSQQKNILVSSIPISDGGEGFEACMRFNASYRTQDIELYNAYGTPIITDYTIIDSHTAVIETSKCCGFRSLIGNLQNTCTATSFGVGQAIQHAIHQGCDKILIGLGGTVTTDCGAGMLQALGADLGISHKATAADLQNIDTINVDQLNYNIKNVSFTAFSDVNNPLLGSEGTASIFAMQKGAYLKDIPIIEQGIEHFSNVAARIKVKDIRNKAGTGAAGGIGFALEMFCDADIISGIDFVFRYHDIEQHIKNSDVIITGEGCFDKQSFMGKCVGKIIDISLKYHKKLFVLCGSSSIKETEKFSDISILPMVKGNISESYALQHTEELLIENTKKIIEMLK